MSASGGGDQPEQAAQDSTSWALPALPAVLVTGWPAYPVATAAELTRRSGLEFTWEREWEGAWEPVGRGLSYTPGGEDLGRRLRLLGCRPGLTADEPEMCAVSGPVLPGPGPCPFERRHRLTEERVGEDGFRLVTYNMLADLYAVRDRAKMATYCPIEFQDIEYRKQGLLAEILGYNTDVLCLQEVDDHLFTDYWAPMLEAAGLSGTFAARMRQGPTDGVATFWSTKFRLVSTERLVIAELAAGDPLLFADVQQALADNSRLRTSFTELPHVLQITVLEEASSAGRPARRLVVANTHLYWNLRTEHLRALQAGVCLRHLERRLDKLRAEDPTREVALVFSGDFNSQPHQSVYHLMTTGELCVQDFNDSGAEEVRGVTFRHEYRLGSACGTPAVTTSTANFCGCFDYIFYMQDRLKVQQEVPLPPAEEVRSLTGLPSAAFPSDHLALAADLHWTG